MSLLTQFTGGGLILRQQIITTTGTWTRPAKMAGNTVWLTMTGGGCSGGYAIAYGGGWSGQFVIRVPVDIGSLASVACTVGAGGAAPSSAAAPNAGAPSSFGAFISVVGGSTSTKAGGVPGGGVHGDTTGGNEGKDTLYGLAGRLISTGAYRSTGAAGILFDTAPTQLPNWYGVMTGARGWGAGGGTMYDGSDYRNQAGARGAILVEWPEFI